MPVSLLDEDGERDLTMEDVLEMAREAAESGDRPDLIENIRKIFSRPAVSFADSSLPFIPESDDFLTLEEVAEFVAEQTRPPRIIVDCIDLLAPFGHYPVAAEKPLCFAAGTLVLMADGTTKAIEKIEVGQMVLACPHDKPEDDPMPCRVIEVYHNAPARLLAVGISLSEDLDACAFVRTTEGHPFYVQSRGWVGAHDLRPGEILRSIDGARLTVCGVEYTGCREPVFNLSVAPESTYFIALPGSTSAFLAHNSSGEELIHNKNASTQPAAQASAGPDIPPLPGVYEPGRGFIPEANSEAMRNVKYAISLIEANSTYSQDGSRLQSMYRSNQIELVDLGFKNGGVIMGQTDKFGNGGAIEIDANFAKQADPRNPTAIATLAGTLVHELAHLKTYNDGGAAGNFLDKIGNGPDGVVPAGTDKDGDARSRAEMYYTNLGIDVRNAIVVDINSRKHAK